MPLSSLPTPGFWFCFGRWQSLYFEIISNLKASRTVPRTPIYPAQCVPFALLVSVYIYI